MKIQKQLDSMKCGITCLQMITFAMLTFFVFSDFLCIRHAVSKRVRVCILVY